MVNVNVTIITVIIIIIMAICTALVSAHGGFTYKTSC